MSFRACKIFPRMNYAITSWPASAEARSKTMSRSPLSSSTTMAGGEGEPGSPTGAKAEQLRHREHRTRQTVAGRGVGTVNVNLEVVTIPVSDVDRALEF